VPATEAESRLSGWIDSSAPAEELLFNNMELAAFEKYVALPELLEALRREFDLAPRMSGSGSACFAFLRDGQDAEPILRRIRECWGEGAFLAEARLE
jgi:4-diphosphocytidyl-2-C-methyl-D-erythritol kinase